MDRVYSWEGCPGPAPEPNENCCFPEEVPAAALTPVARREQSPDWNWVTSEVACSLNIWRCTLPFCSTWRGGQVGWSRRIRKSGTGFPGAGWSALQMEGAGYGRGCCRAVPLPHWRKGVWRVS